MNPAYAAQAKLVVKTIPHISAEDSFALKGGTAINLFELDLPRLSVDIDLVFTQSGDRESAIREINAALVRISDRLARSGIKSTLTGPESARKLICRSENAAVKIEPNFILRGVAFPVRRMSTGPQTSDFLGYAKTNVVSRAELYGGKFCAALDRQHPRDLFDVAQFYRSNNVTDEIKNGFIAMAVCHNRPFHELLNPFPQDQSALFRSQFEGMSDVPFTISDHYETLGRLKKDLLQSLTQEDRRRLLDFMSLQCDASVFGIGNLSTLPAVAWKRKNLQTLLSANPQKFETQLRHLSELLEIA